MFLTPGELAALTGYRVRPKQAAWLRSHGWRHVIAGDGRIIVARAYAERRLVGETATPEPAPGPNFAALAERA